MSRRQAGRALRARIVPVTYRIAFAFVRAHDRHLAPPPGHKFSLGLVGSNGQLVGVVMVGRPVARYLDDGVTAEVTRLCTYAAGNANSALLAAAWRIARAMGYQQMITYTRGGEPDTSLRAAGWRAVQQPAGRPDVDTPGRTRRSRGVDDTARVLWRVTVTDRQRRHLPRDLASPAHHDGQLDDHRQQARGRRP